MTKPRNFTMSFKDAMALDVDYRDFEKVRELPVGIKLVAIIGVWDDYANLRCLFVSEGGKRFCRSVSSRSNYEISELGMFGKDINIGDVFEIKLG